MNKNLTPRENLLLAYSHRCPEWIPNYRTDVCGRLPVEVLERAPGGPQGGTGTDWFGVHWRAMPGIPGATVDTTVPPVLDDVTKWEDVVHFPDLDAIDWKAAAERDAHLYDEQKVRYMSIFNGPFERLHALMGMVEANCAIIEEPEATYALLTAITDYKIALIDRLTDYYPLDLVNLHDDWGHGTSTFLSPQTWRTMIKPHIKRITDFVHSKGLFFDIHSCGYIEPLLPDMVEIGIDGWSSVQCVNDVRTILRKFGRKICLTGGMDNKEVRASHLTAEQVHDLVGKRMDDLCRGGALFPFGNTNANIPHLLDAINECLLERKDFYKTPSNRLFPDLDDD